MANLVRHIQRDTQLQTDTFKNDFQSNHKDPQSDLYTVEKISLSGFQNIFRIAIPIFAATPNRRTQNQGKHHFTFFWFLDVANLLHYWTLFFRSFVNYLFPPWEIRTGKHTINSTPNLLIRTIIGSMLLIFLEVPFCRFSRSATEPKLGIISRFKHPLNNLLYQHKFDKKWMARWIQYLEIHFAGPLKTTMLRKPGNFKPLASNTS